MLNLPLMPPKQDLLEHFARDCAGVKLIALVLIVVLEWARTARYVGIPVWAGLLIAQHVA